MKILIVFQISESHLIHVAVTQQVKTNIYGYKTHELHIFDEIEAKYIHNNKSIILIRDSAQYVIETFCNSLEMALKNELMLDPSLVPGKIGYFFSKEKADNFDEIKDAKNIFSQYWVWSSLDNVQTWLYNANNKIYLEISLTYPWLFSDPEEGENYISFDEYMSSYKPVALIELEKSLVLSWINECRRLLQKMETV